MLKKNKIKIKKKGCKWSTIVTSHRKANCKDIVIHIVNV